MDGAGVAVEGPLNSGPFGPPERAPPAVPEQQQQELLAPGEPGDQQLTPPKTSRYRSLRGKSVSSPRRSKDFDVFYDCDTGDGGQQTTPTRTRSKSVTSHSNAAKKDGTSSDRPALPTLKIPLALKSINTSSPASRTFPAKHKAKGASEQDPGNDLSPKSSPQKEDVVTQQRPNTPGSIRRNNGHDEETARWADEVARLEAETDRILEEQKKRDIARRQAHNAVTPPRPRPTRLILDKLGFLNRGSKTHVSGQPTTPPKSAPVKSFGFNWSPGSYTDKVPSPESMNFVDHSFGHSPQIDAPASASNGGERRVTVRYQSSTITLPVNTDTSPVDIVQATAKVITRRIDPEASIVFECYDILGLERRLRRYERVRDVMNSWDRDQQNSLLIVSFQTPQDDADLNIASVPQTEDPPTGFTFQLHHSCRPGKWNKRWVTLMDNGQIFASKRPDSKSTDKDSAVLGHLSDSDIYVPKEGQMKRHLKAPKTYCYAVKSQHKTTLFPDGENFVHFFSTDEEQLARRFYELVHGWRSWYLGRLREDMKSQAPQIPDPGLRASASISSRGTGRGRPSQDAPLIDMTQLDRHLEETVGKKSLDSPSRKTTNSNKSAPSLPSSNSQGKGEFLAGGLLGDAYDKRKQSDASVATEAKSVEGPFVEGPSLLNSLENASKENASKETSDKPEPSPWLPSALEHSARTRSASKTTPPRRPQTADAATRRERPQHPPIASFLDFPPRPRPSQRVPPPGGRGVKPPAGGPLIDYASGGPTSNHPIPSRSNTRVGPPATQGPQSGRQRSRSTTTTRSGGYRCPPRDPPPMPPMPFRTARRPGDNWPQGEPARGRHHPQEPLINRAR